MIRLLITSLIFPALALIACSNDDDQYVIDQATQDANTNISLQISSSSLEFEYEAESQDITINANHEWSASVSDNWISVSPSFSVESETIVTISVSAYSLSATRTGTVTIACGTKRETINVTQYGDQSADEITCFLDGYSLVWDDEFEEGSELNSDWTHEVKSSYWVNNELQNYVNGSADGRRVTELVDGQLHINCFKGSDGKIYSARVYVKPNVGFTYGYFEARIQLPKGKGTWPAWWMMPVSYDDYTNPWPGCGEIDIMEEVGVDANWVVSTIHCNKYNNSGTSVESAKKYLDTAESDFHDYGLEWTEDYLNFYVDQELLLSYNNDGSGKDAYPFTYAFYPILNVAWGGDWGGYAGVDESALPVTMKVEYVRIFQK